MTSPPPPGQRIPRHYVPRLIIVGSVLVIALWFVFREEIRPSGPIDRWKLPNGDTVDILTNENEYSFTAGVNGSEAGHYLWIRFRGWSGDSARDNRDVAAIFQLVCSDAVSKGYKRIKVEPTKSIGVLKYSIAHWATVDSSGQCEPDRGP